MKKVKVMGPTGKRRTYVLGPDLDFDKDVVLLPNGQRMTNADVDGIVAAAQTAMAGRPSLTAPGTRSPEIKARVPQQTKDQLEALAAQRGTTASEIIREALDTYLKSA